MLMSVHCPWCNEWRALPAYEAWKECTKLARGVCHDCWSDPMRYEGSGGVEMHTLIKRSYKIMEKQ